ncbi:stage III sporulation protein AE [Thalassorhabdus alkalitolerans]|uniref:stage III sporulation protein AE n=1 Tax=Thalassorhabdus alkalitolerans TaxID=2282697 RepID=UPI003AA80F5D
MKKGQAAAAICLIILAFLWAAQPVLAEEEPGLEQREIAEYQLDKLGLEDIHQFWEEISQDYGAFLPESQKGSLLEFVKGEKTFSPKEWGYAFLNFLFHELIANGKLLGTLILLSIFSTMLRALQNAFEHDAVSRVAYSITFIVLIVIALNSFYVAMIYVQESVSNMVHFMIALFPLLMALLASMGAVTTVALFHPLIMFLVNTSGLMIQYFVLPLLFFSALLSIVSSLSEYIQVTKLATLLRSIALWALGVFLTIFLGVISVQGATAAVTDGVAVKTAKFIAGNFVPVVGRVFTDAADTVMGASLLLKNTVGMAGVAVLFMICAFPAIKVLSIALIFHAAAAVLQPLGAGELLEALSTLGRTVLYMFAALAIVGLMFFLAITMVVASGNLSLMVR